MPSRLLLFVVVVAVLGAAMGCLISTDDYSKTCTAVTDCPKLSNYKCVSANAWPQVDCAKDEKGCLCAVKFPPDPINPTDGGGGGAGGGAGGGGGTFDAGPPPSWCGRAGDPTALKPIRAIFNLSCVGTCHGPQMGYPNAPKTFRLDYYSSDAGVLPDGGTLPGAYFERELIKIRTFDVNNPMPPSDFPLPPTAEQKAEIWNWVDAGAPYGDDALCNPPDSGISFATDVKPIFMTRCGPCHLTMPYQGGLNLTSSAAYGALVNVDSTCGGTSVKRVLAFDTKNSLLWEKLTPDGGACGSTMPDGGPPLRVSHSMEFDTIEAWIAQGAKNN